MIIQVSGSAPTRIASVGIQGPPGSSSSGITALTGDVTASGMGSVAATVVQAQNGALTFGANGGTFYGGISSTGILWASGNTFTLSQNPASAGAAPVNSIWAPQAPNAGSVLQTSNTPGSAVIAVAAPGSSGVAGLEAGLQITRAGNGIAWIQAFTSSPSYSGLWLGASPSSGGNTYSILSNGATTYLNASASIGMELAGVPQTALTSSGLQWTATATFALSQASTSGATGSNLTLTPQQTSNANGTCGSLVVNLGVPIGSGSESYLTVTRSTISEAMLGAYAPSPSAFGALYLLPSGSPSASNVAIFGNGGQTYIAASSSIFTWFGGNQGPQMWTLSGTQIGYEVSAAQFGGGVGVLGISNANTIPSSNPSGGGVLYVTAGKLTYRGSSGTVTTLAVA